MESNRQRFAMRRHGLSTPTSTITMSKGIGMSCKYTDIISTTQNLSYSVTHAFDPLNAADAQRTTELIRELQHASKEAGFNLLPIQIKAICRIVRKPSSTITTTPQYPEGAARMYRTPRSDVMSPVILDMPTGTGKTITSLLGAILFAIERREDMQKQCAVSPTPSGVVEVTGCPGWDASSAPVDGRCVFFTPRHLVQHWIDHADIAKAIVDRMPFGGAGRWTVRVVVNKRPSTVTTADNEVVVIICDSTRCSIKKYLEPSVHYSAMCFDEAGERNGKVNALCQTMIPNVRHGRIIMVSADFSKWKFSFDPNKASVFKYIFPRWNVYDANGPSAVACRSAAVFSSSERASVLEECTSALESTVLDVASVGYRPSLVERLGGGYATELGDDIGCDLFFRNYGVEVSGCNTADDIIKCIESAVEGHHLQSAMRGVSYPQRVKLAEKINVLHGVREKILEIASERCPCCLERKADIAIIQPCLHSVCRACLVRLQSICPMCRGGVAGSIGVVTHADKKPRLADRRGARATHERIGSLFFDELAELCGPCDPDGVMQAIQYTLMAIQNARSKSGRSTKALRTMLICPGANMRQGLFENMGFDVMYYRTSGTKDDMVTMKRLNEQIRAFKADDGRSKLLCVRDAGHGSTQDCMTGLDIPNLDCVVSLGGYNLAQRMGRLCRLSRMSLPEEEKHGLYVDIVPTLE